MLVLTRRYGERLALDLPGVPRIWIQVAEVRPGAVKLAFDAPKECVITREELLITDAERA